MNEKLKRKIKRKGQDFFVVDLNSPTSHDTNTSENVALKPKFLETATSFVSFQKDQELGFLTLEDAKNATDVIINEIKKEIK